MEKSTVSKSQFETVPEQSYLSQIIKNTKIITNKLKNLRIVWIGVVMIFFLMPVHSVESSNRTASKMLCSDAAYRNNIKSIWHKRKPTYYEWTKDVAKMSESNRKHHPYHLYNIQIETNNLLKYSEYCKDYYILDELISLYARPLNSLVKTNQYLFYMVI